MEKSAAPPRRWLEEKNLFNKFEVNYLQLIFIERELVYREASLLFHSASNFDLIFFARSTFRSSGALWVMVQYCKFMRMFIVS